MGGAKTDHNSIVCVSGQKAGSASPKYSLCDGTTCFLNLLLLVPTPTPNAP
jgi:hypothetical protein